MALKIDPEENQIELFFVLLVGVQMWDEYCMSHLIFSKVDSLTFYFNVTVCS